MKQRSRLCPAVLLIGVLAFSIAAARGAQAMEEASELIRNNVLLGAVYKKDPASAVRIAGEVKTFLASAEQGKLSKDGTRGPKFRRRGGAAVQPGDPESELERQNRQVFEENPALRKMYFHSPVAYLRMLKRLR